MSSGDLDRDDLDVPDLDDRRLDTQRGNRLVHDQRLDPHGISDDSVPRTRTRNLLVILHPDEEDAAGSIRETSDSLDQVVVAERTPAFALELDAEGLAPPDQVKDCRAIHAAIITHSLWSSQGYGEPGSIVMQSVWSETTQTAQ